VSAANTKMRRKLLLTIEVECFGDITAGMVRDDLDRMFRANGTQVLVYLVGKHHRTMEVYYGSALVKAARIKKEKARGRKSDSEHGSGTP
jgi:hypothetical protein